MKKSKILVLQLAIAMLPAACLLLIWQQLPERVAIHYDSQFQTNGYGTRPDLLMVLLVLMAISLGASWLMLNLGKVDPKRRAAEAQIEASGVEEPAPTKRSGVGVGVSPLMAKISWTIVVFLSILGGFIIYLSAFDQAPEGSMISRKYFVVLIALLMAALGNLMNNIKPNYFVGIRTPWNLSDETNWRKTHHLASRIWFFGGLLMVVLIISLPVDLATIIMIAGSCVLVIIPIGYSWWVFKQS